MRQSIVKYGHESDMDYLNRYNRSRIYKKIERKSRKSLLINVIGIIIVIFIVIKFGVPILINFTLFISGSKDSDSVTKTEEKSFIPSPILDSTFTATNSATITVSGTSINSDYITLYLNNIISDQVKPQKDGGFSFETTLTKEENTIKTKAVKGNKESDFSEVLYISLKKSAPTLRVESPLDGQVFSKDQNVIEVKGETDPFAKVTVNDFWAISDQSNNFFYNLQLKDGENQIKIIAADQAGNKAEKNIKVTYSP